MNIEILKLLSILFVIFTFLSCNEIKKSDPVILKSIEITETFEYKLNNEPKIFLKFWSGMNLEEYFKVCQILEDEGSLKKEYSHYLYLLGDNEMVVVEPFNFDKKPIVKYRINLGDDINKLKIDGVILKHINKNVYDLFSEKYKLQPCYEKFICSASIEYNPEYKNYDVSKGFMSLPLTNLEIEELLKNYYKDYTYMGIPPVQNELFRCSLNEPQIVELENKVIIFKDLYDNYREDDVIFFKKNLNERVMTINEIKKERETMIKLRTDTKFLGVLYTSKTVYKDHIDKVNLHNGNEKKYEEKLIKEDEERKVNSLNEI